MTQGAKAWRFSVPAFFSVLAFWPLNTISDLAVALSWMAWNVLCAQDVAIPVLHVMDTCRSREGYVMTSWNTTLVGLTAEALQAKAQAAQADLWTTRVCLCACAW